MKNDLFYVAVPCRRGSAIYSYDTFGKAWNAVKFWRQAGTMPWFIGSAASQDAASAELERIKMAEAARF